MAKAMPVSIVMHVAQDDTTAATNSANGTNSVVCQRSRLVGEFGFGDHCQEASLNDLH
jgi:hypothetical protein